MVVIEGTVRSVTKTMEKDGVLTYATVRIPGRYSPDEIFVHNSNGLELGSDVIITIKPKREQP